MSFNNIFIIIFLSFITGCTAILEDTKDIILSIDKDCNILGINGNNGDHKILVKSKIDQCNRNPVWINKDLFIYYIEYFNVTSYTTYPLISFNIRTSKQKEIYKSKASICDFSRFSDEKMIIQEKCLEERAVLFDIKSKKFTELLNLYPKLRSIVGYKSSFDQNFLVFFGLDSIKQKIYPKAWEKDKNRDVLFDIYIYNLNKKELIQLTDTPWSDEYPTWSPDGKYIAFSSNKEGNYDIYILELETREKMRLNSNPGNDLYPEYSPDGKKIAFISNRSGSEQIWIMDSDGKNLKQLTEIEGGVGYGLSWNSQK